MSTTAIFHEWMLPPCDTFILQQAKALKRYRPVLVGLNATCSESYADLTSVLLNSTSGALAKTAARVYRYTRFAPNFHRRIGNLRPGVLHAHFATDAVSALPIANCLDLPLVVSLHGYDVTTADAHFARTRFGRNYLKLRNKLFERTTRFLCVSKSIYKSAVQAGFPESKLQVHYTGVDCRRFRPVPTPRDPKLVLFVGRLVEKKGVEYLLSAMKLLRVSDPEAHLEIIGEGPLYFDLKALADSLGLHVNFRGRQSPEEVLSRMLRARVLCNPSVTAANGDSEGFGMVFAEAQAVGTPVVSSRHAAIPEAVDDGNTGILCRERAPEELAVALLKFLKDDSFWSQSSERAVSWVRNNFDLAKQTEALESIYDSVH